jgi:hypothetical protein
LIEKEKMKVIINNQPPTHHEKAGYCRINNMMEISYLGDARAAGAKPLGANSKIGVTPKNLSILSRFRG